jgi:hypothetical protein
MTIDNSELSGFEALMMLRQGMETWIKTRHQVILLTVSMQLA